MASDQQNCHGWSLTFLNHKYYPDVIIIDIVQVENAIWTPVMYTVMYTDVHRYTTITN